MNIYEYAQETEKNGIRYYRELATHAQNFGIKKVFTMMAGEEQKLPDEQR